MLEGKKGVSLYDYIKENINVNGKFSADASLREYVENQKKDSDLDLYNEDNLYIGKEKISFDFLFGKVDKVELEKKEGSIVPDIVVYSCTQIPHLNKKPQSPRGPIAELR